jgi:CHRD domain
VRRLLLLAALVLTAVAASATTNAQPSTKLWICHKADENRYVAIRVRSRAQLRGHMRHGDISAGVPQTRAAARAFCRALTITPTRGGQRNDATLTPVAPNTTGSGSFTFRAAQGRETLCWSLTVQNLAPAAGAVTMAHIHGPLPSTAIFIGLTLSPTQLANLNASLSSTGRASVSGCETVDRAKVRQLLRNLDDFYVNVHTTTFPNGALQGTLAR